MAQTQTPALLWQDEDDVIDYTPASACYAGDVVLLGAIPAIVQRDIAASALGSVIIGGVAKVPKDTSTFTVGDAVYWNATGSPVTGTASTGAATSTASANLMGTVVGVNAATGDSYVYVLLTAAKRTATIAGAAIVDSITGDTSSTGITGAAPATTSSAGGAVVTAGGIGGSVSGAGGLVSMTGGAGTLNAVGGVASSAGGAGNGTGAGAVSKVVGGLGGTTGAGGAAQLTGGAGGATSGTGGAATIAAGAATGTTAVGGAATITGGASAGASGTAGVASIDAGAGAGGTKACVNITDVNGLATYINRGPLCALQVGLTLTALGTTQNSTPTAAQLLGGLLSQTGATGAGTVTLPSGTTLSSACPRTPVVGDTFECDFYNLGGSQTLTITGASGTTVVGTAAVGTGKMSKLKFYNTGSNTWNIYVIVSA